MNRYFDFQVIVTMFCLLGFTPALPQQKSATVSPQYQLYQNCSKVYNLFNQGNDIKANNLADSIIDSNQLGYQLPYWGYLTSYKGSILHHGGNFFLSKKYYQLSSLLANNLHDHYLQDYIVNNYSGLLLESLDSTAARNTLNAQIIGKNIPPGSSLFIGIHGNLALLAMESQDTLSAVKEFRLLEKNRNALNRSDPVWIVADRNYGRFLQGTGEFDKALSYLRKALAQSRRLNGENHYQTGICNYALGGYFSKTSQKDSAFFHYNQAYKILSASNPDTVGKPGRPQYEFVYLQSLLKIGELKQMADVSLDEAFGLFTKAINRIVELSHSITSETTRFVVAEKGRSAFNHGIACALKLYEKTRNQKYLETAFKWSLQAKSLSLNWLVEKDLVYPLVGIPDHLIRSLQTNRQILERVLGDTLNPDTSVSADSIIHVLRDYENSEKLIQSSYNQIREANLKNPAQLFSDYSSMNPSSLAENYLGFYELDSAIVVFGFNRKEIYYTLIQKDSLLLSEINQFKFNLRNKPLSSYDSEQVKSYTEIGYSLFKKIILPVLGKSNGHNLVIHPDGILNGIPFEALVTANSDVKLFRDLPYLMNKYNIRYVSTSMLNHIPGKVSSNAITIVSCKNSEGIPETVNEISEIQGVVHESAIHYIDDPASTIDSVFISPLRIHILTHLLINHPDPLKSGLACYPSGPAIIRFHDILYLNLSGKHVFINGCESGNGPLNHGEGLMSLGLAFSIAGCSSVIEHYWTVSDRAAVELSGNFYRNIRRLPDYRALQKAKTDYLKSSSPGNDHPFYWAGIVCFSNSQSNNHGFLLILSGAGLLTLSLLAYWLFLKRRRR